MILTWILNAILGASRDLWKLVKLLAGLSVLLAQQVAGWIGALLLLACKNVIARGLLIAGTIALLGAALGRILALGSLLFSWTGLNAAIHRAISGHEGIMWLAYNVIAVDALFDCALALFSTWLSCWAVSRALQHTALITRFGILRGFWR